MRTVRLYGRLGATFGRVFRFALDTNTVGEAINALSSQLPGFRAYLLGAKDRGMAFAVFAGKENLGEDDLVKPTRDDIRIAPVIIGAKSGGLFQIVLGAVLIVAGGFVTGMSFGGASFIGGAMIKVGWGMVFGGVMQLLSPKPKAAKSADKADNQPSYVFNGALNTQAQGNPVPLGYGRMIVGSAVISAGIQAEDYAPASVGVESGTPDGNARTTPYDP